MLGEDERGCQAGGIIGVVMMRASGGHELLQGMMQLIVTTQDDDMVDRQVVSAIRKFVKSRSSLDGPGIVQREVASVKETGYYMQTDYRCSYICDNLIKV